MKVTVVFEVENTADIESLRRNIGTSVLVSWGLYWHTFLQEGVPGEIKNIQAGDAIADVQELMDCSGCSHDGILA